MENRFIFVTLTFTFVVFFLMTGISVATYQKQVSEVRQLHIKFEEREKEIDRLIGQLAKNNEDIRRYKRLVERYEQKIEEYEIKVSQLKQDLSAQKQSIQEVRRQANF